MKYKITRFYEDDRDSQVIKRGLTEAEAKEHCNRPDTHGDGWFDGFGKESLLDKVTREAEEMGGEVRHLGGVPYVHITQEA